MRTLRQIGPLAVVVAIVCAATWVLLDGGDPIGAWLLAGLLAAHGLVHLAFLIPAPARSVTASGPEWPFDLGRSWLVGRMDAGSVRTAGVILAALVVGCSVLAALATVGIIVPTAWWAPLVVGAAVSSLVLLAMGYSPTLLLGIAIDLALLWLALGASWRPVG